MAVPRMKWFSNAIGMVLAASILAAPIVSAADCGCKSLVPAIQACWTADWPRLQNRSPKTRDELEAWLDDLSEGTDEGVKCIMKSGCFKDEDDMEAKFEPCTGKAWSGFADLLDRAHDRMTKLGAITQAYGTYMDVERPSGVEERLAAQATRILGHESDPVVVAALLKMLEPYEFETPEMLKLILDRMASDSELVRRMAWDAFQQSSGSPLPFDPGGTPDVRGRQLKEIRASWSRSSQQKE